VTVSTGNRVSTPAGTGHGAVPAVFRVLVACLLAGVISVMFGGVAMAGPAVTPVAVERMTAADHAAYAMVQGQPAPPGPDLPPAPTTEDAANSQDRIVMGVVAVALLAIVILGRRARAKRKKK
jgi:hypothetical protein